MQNLNTPTVISKPFAENGLKNTIPENPTGTNKASLDEGFPLITATLPTNGGMPPERADFNGVLNLSTQSGFFAQNGGTYTFNQEVSDAIGGYPLNARLWYLDENGESSVLRSTKNNNMDNFLNNPAVIGDSWVYDVVTQAYVNNEINEIRTNCITEIPQDIKLEFSNGTMTLKAGSKVWIPYGTTEAYQVGDTDDYNHTVVATSWDGSKFFYAIETASDVSFKSGSPGVSTNNLIVSYNVGMNNFGWVGTNVNCSGTSTDVFANSYMYYNTDRNVIRINNATSGNIYSLPFCLIGPVTTAGSVSYVGQTFNGFGYIGSTNFTLPNIKMLASNGRNEDGTLKNFKITTDKIYTYTYNSTHSFVNFNPAFIITKEGVLVGLDYIVSPIFGSIPPDSGWFYNTETNRVYFVNSNGFDEQPWIMFGNATTTNGLIKYFRPNSAFEAVNYNDLVSQIVDLNGPIGSIIAFAANSAPNGYLICNGGSVSRSTYADLFNLIGTTYGAGDGSTTFNLPNLTDKFIQGSGTAGTAKSAGLPNITGQSTGFESESGSNVRDGAIETFITGTGYGGGASRNYRGIKFNASWSSGIYGGSSTVQPPALTMRFYIKY